MKICICGGGNLGHVIAGFVASRHEHEVVLLTRHPERWSHQLSIETPEGKSLSGTLSGIFSDSHQALENADIVLLCMPGFAIAETLRQIKDDLCPSTPVGSVVSNTGFFFQALNILPASQPLFGFQRVPFISRTIEYGHRARLMGYKSNLNVAIEHMDEPESLRSRLESLFCTPVNLLGSYYEASLSNSNPLLHPARLYTLWKDWHEGITYTRIPLFYEEWTEEAADLYITMDQELQALLRELPIRPDSIPSVLDYYESTDAPSLARKLQSITAFKGIQAPMRITAEGYVPDFHSRYFTEDFPYGLAIIERVAKANHISTPTISTICRWGENVLKNHQG